MMQLITPDLYGEFASELKEMHGLRYRVFKERLDWEVQTEDEIETDAFDGFKPVYLLLKGSDWRIRGCVRLLPSTGPQCCATRSRCCWVLTLCLRRPTYGRAVVSRSISLRQRPRQRAGWPKQPTSSSPA